ncbi:MAG: hypothetical protein FK730_14915 [Asgard group archaeon]|nr:hypothetical protein [Asgard group archaeon]
MSKKKLKNLSLIILLSSTVLILPINTNIETAEGALPSDGMKILCLLSNWFLSNWFNFEVRALEALGFTVVTASESSVVNDQWDTEHTVDLLFSEVVITDYVALHIPPGGFWDNPEVHPENLTLNIDAMEIVKDAYNNDLIMMASLDGAIVYAAADIISGKNLTCNPSDAVTLTDAGATYIASGNPTVDAPFITWHETLCGVAFTEGTVPYLIDLLKLLGIFEEDPPSLDDLTVEIDSASDPGTINVTADFSDAWGTESVMLNLFKYNPTTTLYENDSISQMSNNTDSTVFTLTKSNLAAGNYTIYLIAKDILGNEEIYENQFTFDITAAAGNPLVTTLTIISSSILIMVVIRRKKSK